MTVGAYDIPYEDRLVTGPTIEPLDLEEVKKQRRFAATSLDTLFDTWVSAARQAFEEETQLQLLTATRVFLLDECPASNVIMVSRGPVQLISAVTYIDGDGVEQTFDAANYAVIPPVAVVDTYPQPGGIQLVSGSSWPSLDSRTQAMRIEYVAGFGAAPGDVPEIIKYAVMQYVGSFHRQGEETTDKQVYTLPLGAQMVIREAKGHMKRTVFPRRSATAVALLAATSVYP